MSIYQLTPQQIQILTYISGLILIEAGPGCGKTFIIIETIKNLINKHNINPNSILFLTFSDRSRDDMELKLHAAGLYNVKVMTYHSYGKQFISTYPNNFGYQTSPKFIDNANILETICGNYQSIINLKKFKGFLSHTVNTLKFPNTNGNLLTGFWGSISKDDFKSLLSKYIKALKEKNLLDFDMMLYLPYRLFKNDTSLIGKFGGGYKYIFIDEMQDINNLQYKFIEYFIKSTNNIFIVGDPKQNIYTFRGSDYKLIEKFSKTYNPTKHYLTTTFRSTKQIAALANYIISGAKSGPKTPIKSERDGPKPCFILASDNTKFVKVIKKIVYILRKKGVPYSEIAILMRRNISLIDIEHELDNENIPVNFSNADENRFIHLDKFRDLVEMCLDFSSYDVSKRNSLIEYLYPALSLTTEEINNFSKIILNKNKRLGLSKERYYNQARNLRIIIEKFNEMEDIEGKASILTGYYLGRCKENSQIKKEEYSRTYLHNLLTKIELKAKSMNSINDLFKFMDQIKQKEPECITLTTMHGVKGLEYSAVILLNLIEGILPDHRNDLEEERRVLYVGVTRAKKYLYIVNNKNGVILKKKVIKNNKVTYIDKPYETISQFISDIPEEYLDYKEI